jgi:hypothetical protein
MTTAKGRKRPKFRVGQRVRSIYSGNIYRIRGKFWDGCYGNWRGTWRYRVVGRGSDFEPIQQILRPLTRREAGKR